MNSYLRGRKEGGRGPNLPKTVKSDFWFPKCTKKGGEVTNLVQNFFDAFPLWLIAKDLQRQMSSIISMLEGEDLRWTQNKGLNLVQEETNFFFF